VDTRERDPRVPRALEYISARASLGSLTLGDVAGAVGLSTWHLARLLRRHTGLTFKAHVRETRLNAAGGLLMATGLSVKEIATQVGYAHPTDFNRQFKRVFSSTPAAWRRLRLAAPAD
jgi:AraC family transcriptional regulator